MAKTVSPIIRFLVLVFVVALVGGGGWLWWNDGLKPVDATDTDRVTFIINRGETARNIAANLAQEDLIRSPSSFFLLIKAMGIEREIQAGNYRLARNMSAREIAEELTHGIVDVWVTTLEGWRVEEVAMQLSADLDIPEQEFLAVAREGYMFPDTYLIPRDATAAAVAQIFQDTFDQKITGAMRQDARATGLTLPEIVTLASIIEREGRSDLDRPVIAGILYNRMEQDWPLQVDATLQYALGYQPEEKSWWKETLYDVDKRVASSYNTYANGGLPPGPIANPGLASIMAAIYPERSEYMYYLHDPTGTIHYATDLAGHEQNIATYLR